MLLILAFLWMAYNGVLGISEARSAETLSVDGSKLISLREGIDDIGEMTLQTFIDRLVEFNVGGFRMKVTIHPHSRSNPSKGFEVLALNQSEVSPSPIRFTFLPSRIDDKYLVLETVAYQNKKITKFSDKFQVLAQLAILRMDIEGMRRQEEESLRRSKQIQLCMQTQRQWLSQAENALRRELRLPDNATYAERQRAMEEERLRVCFESHAARANLRTRSMTEAV